MKYISVAPPSSPPHAMGIFFPFCSTVAVCRPCGADLVPRGIDGSRRVCLPETLGCERGPQSAQRLPTRGWPAGREQEQAVHVLKGHLSLLETSRPYSFSEVAEFQCTALSLSPDRNGSATEVRRTLVMFSKENLKVKAHFQVSDVMIQVSSHMSLSLLTTLISWYQHL